MSTIDIAIPGDGKARVRVHWMPAQGEPIGWAWVQHGFARSGRNLDGVAGLLSAAGIASARPDISSFTRRGSMHDPEFLTRVTLAMADAIDAGVLRADRGRWIGVGHSAGAAVVAHAAATLRARGSAPRSLVLLDPVDTVGGLLAAALPGLADQAMTAFELDPSRCNRHGTTMGLLVGRPGVRVTKLPGLSHADPERIPAVLAVADVRAPSRAAGLLCGTPGTAARVIELGEATRAAAVDACSQTL